MGEGKAISRELDGVNGRKADEDEEEEEKGMG